MMKTLLCSLIMLVSLTGYSQKSFTYHPEENQKADRLIPLQKSVPDTLFPDFLLDNCYQGNVNSYFVPDTGFLVGTTIFADVLQLQRVVNPSSSNFSVSELSVLFVPASEAAQDIMLSAVVYSDVDENGVPTLIGRSDQISAGDLSRDTTGGLSYSEFTFSTPVNVTTDTFLIGVDFTNAYTATSVIFMGLYASLIGCRDGTNLVQGSLTNTDDIAFGNFSQYYNGINVEIPMFVAVDNILSATNGPQTADYKASISPNPIRDRAYIQFAAYTPGRYALSITDLTGRETGNRQSGQFSDHGSFETNLSDLPAGLYLYHIDGPAGRQSGKVIKR